MTQSNIMFGHFLFDPISGQLSRNNQSIAVGQRAAALLQALVKADHQPVTKSALLEAAWPGVIVGDANLTVQIGTLRKALGARPDGTEWIVTVPRIGYRLMRPQTGGEKESPLPLLAVLPFANLGGDAGQEYLADGIVGDIMTALSRFRSFAFISRNSSFAYKDRAVDMRLVATELGAR